MSQVWLIGRPVAHSLSPAMHNTAFAKLGLPHRYELKETADDQLGATLDRLRRDDDLLGANVTIPYKETVLRLVDEVDDEARRIGAVNTIVCRGGRLIGHNTDRIGFHNGLEGAGMLVSNADVMVLGAGGAARACILELQVGNDLLVANRSFERAERLVASMPKEKEGELRAISWDEARQVAWVDVLVNATPMGMNGEDALEGFAFEPLPPMIADLVPVAAETPLVRRAREAQHVRVMDGLLMLLHQAARSFELWTGVPAPLEVMRAALPRPV
ncbi:MAG: shikimate dehydrogenase [Chloroflexi bacterium 13_1_40CM_67_9]|nr:MAG: shikimate dehydrogenase [Chloroflexi bacterium 13_1_40CM_67_9]